MTYTVYHWYKKANYIGSPSQWFIKLNALWNCNLEDGNNVGYEISTFCDRILTQYDGAIANSQPLCCSSVKKHIITVCASTVCILQQYFLRWINVVDWKGYQGNSKLGAINWRDISSNDLWIRENYVTEMKM